MEVQELGLGVLLLRPRVFRDVRGAFRETWRRERYREAGIGVDFVQDNVSVSGRRVLRGLHYQHPAPQGKLITVLQGEIWDVAADIRVGSPTFGQWRAAELGADDGAQLWIPEGLAHGFLVLGAEAVVHYKCTTYYDPAGDATVAWDDPDLGVPWPLSDPVLSEKDAAAPRLRDLARERLPRWGASLAPGAGPETR